MFRGLFVAVMLVAIVSGGNIAKDSGKHRTKRGGFWGFFETLGGMRRIINQQYNETVFALNQIYDLIADGFSDTTPTKRPWHGKSTSPRVSTDESNSTSEPSDMATTTEKFRVSRVELGRILNKNYRGLRKLFDLELRDALNQSNYNVRDYQRQFKNALAPYAVFKNTSKTHRHV